MLDTHAFFLGFWTTVAVIIAGAYIIMCCYEHIACLIYNAVDKINDYIDTRNSAIAQKLPLDETYVVHV